MFGLLIVTSVKKLHNGVVARVLWAVFERIGTKLPIGHRSAHRMAPSCGEPVATAVALSIGSLKRALFAEADDRPRITH